MIINNYEHPIRTHRLQASRSHQKSIDSTPLYIKRIRRHFIDIRGINDVWMCNNVITNLRERLYYRRCVTRVTTNLRSDTSRHDKSSVEGTCAFYLSFSKLKYGTGVLNCFFIQATKYSNLALVLGVIHFGNRKSDRDFIVP